MYWLTDLFYYYLSICIRLMISKWLNNEWWWKRLSETYERIELTWNCSPFCLPIIPIVSVILDELQMTYGRPELLLQLLVIMLHSPMLLIISCDPYPLLIILHGLQMFYWRPELLLQLLAMTLIAIVAIEKVKQLA